MSTNRPKPLPPLGDWQDRFWPKVEKSDQCWNWTASTDGHGYGQLRVGGRLYLAHRLAYLLGHAVDPGAMQVDHRCFNPLCVNPSHLRLASIKSNHEHLRLNANNKSGARGVSRHRSKWSADVWHHGEKIYLGLFSTVEEAAAAARAKRLELYTHNDADRVPA